MMEKWEMKWKLHLGLRVKYPSSGDDIMVRQGLQGGPTMCCIANF